jgi:hypothetical protein
MASSNQQPLDYKQAGVDIDAGDELVRRIKKMNPTLNTGFGGLVPFGDSFLVSGTDGVGTKLRLAFDMDKHDTVRGGGGGSGEMSGLVRLDGARVLRALKNVLPQNRGVCPAGIPPVCPTLPDDL